MAEQQGLTGGEVDRSPIDHVEVDRAVRNLTARYCDAVARNDGALFASLWTADADWVAAGHTTSGRERIARVFGKLRRDYVLCTQELMSGYVEPLDDPQGPAADARWQIRELQWKTDAPVSCVLGIYSDHVVFDDGAWRFARRQFDILYRGPVDLSGAITPKPQISLTT
jgi:uncharacterized protein (TIGR02246 family)